MWYNGTKWLVIENDEDRVKKINTLIINNKTLKIKTPDAEMTLLANDEEDYEREGCYSRDQLDEFINKVVDLNNERESNTHIIKINRVNKNHNKIQKTSK